MISLIILGLFPCVPSLILFPHFSTSSLGCPLSSVSPSRPSSVTTAASLITPPHVPSSSLTACTYACRVPIPPPRTVRLNA
uniref:Secreted peptide n=1 Tax=Setaria viridis TaxID=4556 RepID=A0A4U6UK13_SETVI|nr:hypothetical protein SEVIR_5G216575v2 [Setaria viridis]TKW20845.1 hypothetical protein SEVIR_4G116201v2 [Setaria viridis]